MRRAVALTGPLHCTREQLVAGRVSAEQVDVIVEAVADLPGGSEVRQEAESMLLDHATTLDAGELRKAGRHLITVLDPDGEDRRIEAQLERDERAAHVDRYLSITDDGAGGVRIRGRGSAEDGAIWKAAILPLTCPRPAVDEADGEGPVYDPRDHGARAWDAAVTVFQHALDTQLVPDSHRVPARLIITMTRGSLLEGIAAATGPGEGLGLTGDGLELPPGVLRRLACDADVIPVVLGSRGEVLDVGRASRTVTVPIWTALVARDRHCAFPGCTRPPVMCHAHHLRSWARGGKTSLDNLALVCGHHHRVIHATPWEIRINPKDEKPEFSPPPRLGRPRTWMRYRARPE